MKRAIIVGGLVVVLFDLVWATIARFGGFDYAALGPVSLVLYASAGFLATWKGPIWQGIVTGLLVAGIDATLGWAVSAAIGPGSVNGPVWLILSTAIVVMITGAILGAIGAGVARVARRFAG